MSGFAFRPAVTPWWHHCSMVDGWLWNDPRWELVNDPELVYWLCSGQVS